MKRDAISELFCKSHLWQLSANTMYRKCRACGKLEKKVYGTYNTYCDLKPYPLLDPIKLDKTD